MPKTRVVFFREEDGSVPLLDWLDSLQARAKAKCFVRIERLGLLGHEMRRPEKDYLRDGIHELRIGLQGVNYRVLFFFCGEAVVVLSHGLTKERSVPGVEIDRAVTRKEEFESDPQLHTYEE